MGVKGGVLLSCRRSGLVVKIRHKSNLLRLSIVSSGGLAVPGPKALRGLHNIPALSHLVKDCMLPIWPLGLGSADKKLGTIWVGAICHGQDPRTCVFRDEILIIKFLP